MRDLKRFCDQGKAWLIIVLSAAFVECKAARAIEGANQEPAALSQAQPPLPQALSETLPQSLRQLTDPDGLRTQLEQAGLRFTFTYYGDALGNPSGGIQQGSGYSARFGTIIDADLDKLMGWEGANFHASIHEIFGPGLSGGNLDNLMLVSSIEAPPSTRLFNLWIEQKIGAEANLRVGQFAASQEFVVSQNANLFVNSTFGWPVILMEDLPSGGPSYPEATPGARLKYTPNDQISVVAALFDGDPAGPGSGDPVSRDPFGLDFRVSDPPLLITEMAFAYQHQSSGAMQDNPNQEGASQNSAAAGQTSLQENQAANAAPANPLGALKLGALFHTGLFSDERFNARGGLLAASNADPQQHFGNYAVYGVIDQALWRLEGDGDRGLNVFVRACAAPSDRNLIDLYLDAGLTFKGPLAGRPNDAIGLGFAYARISPEAAARDRDIVALTGTPAPIRDFEAAIELTYQVHLAANWSLQPDLQYIIHPGGRAANPLAPESGAPIPNALVIGMRTIVKF